MEKGETALSSFTTRQVVAFLVAIGSYWPVRLALFMMITLPERLVNLNDRTTRGCQEGDGIETYYAIVGGIAGIGLLTLSLGGALFASALLRGSSQGGRFTFTLWTIFLQAVVIGITVNWDVWSAIALIAWGLLSFVVITMRIVPDHRRSIRPRTLVLAISAVSVLVFCSSCAMLAPSYCIN